MKHPTMTATAVEFSRTRVVIDVEHAGRQSFSRAVDPRAKQEFMAVARRNGYGGPWHLTAVARNVEPGTYVDRYVSRYTYERNPS